MYRSQSRNGYHFRRNNFRRPAPRFASQSISNSYFIKKADPQKETEVFVPKLAFADLPVEHLLKSNILKKGYAQPTPIQDATMLPIMEGKDVVGIANTGTGKTAAFLIPLINKVIKNREEKILIIVPTRELAAQIRDEFRSLSWGLGVYATLCIGGAFIRNQIFEIRRNPQFVIGTPGRLKDLMEKKVLNIGNFNTIVLDEVDRMLDMGFLPDIKSIISLLPQERQSLFFSATISPNITKLIQSFVVNPVTFSVKKQDTTENVDQDIVRVENGKAKIEVLEQLLKQNDFKKVLIFGKTKYGVENLSVTLYKRGFKVAAIHGDKPQFKRNQAIRLFKDNVVNILVATDVASRGIDIQDITHVINYDKPATYEDYIHRIGRTGRGNKKGIALTFIN